MATATEEVKPVTKESKSRYTAKNRYNRYTTTITPEMAKEWLNHNPRNRDLRPTHVEKLARDILLGEWEYNGDPIRFDKDGNLIDGQHRLLAIVATGIPVDSDVIEGMPTSVQERVDTNRWGRTLKDVLKLRGESNATTLAAALNLIFRWQAGAVRPKAENNPSHGQAIALLEKHPEIRDAVAHGSRLHSLGVRMSTATIAACWYVFSKINDEDCRDFWNAVGTGFYIDGTAASVTSGPYRLQRYLTAEMRGKHRVEQVVKHAVTIKAWNAYRRGADIQLLGWKQGGSKREQFPEAV